MIPCGATRTRFTLRTSGAKARRRVARESSMPRAAIADMQLVIAVRHSQLARQGPANRLHNYLRAGTGASTSCVPTARCAALWTIVYA